MRKQDKINQLEKECDNLKEQLRVQFNTIERHAIVFRKEIIQAQITALNWEFDDDISNLDTGYFFCTNCRQKVAEDQLIEEEYCPVCKECVEYHHF